MREQELGTLIVFNKEWLMGNYVSGHGDYDDIPDKNTQGSYRDKHIEDPISHPVVKTKVIPTTPLRFISDGFGTDIIDEETYQREIREGKEKAEKKKEDEERLKLEGLKRIEKQASKSPTVGVKDEQKKPMFITFEPNSPVNEKPIIFPKKKQTTTLSDNKKKGKVLKYNREADFYVLEGETFSVKELIKEIPGRKWFQEENVWKVPFNDKSKQMLDIIIDKQIR